MIVTCLSISSGSSVSDKGWIQALSYYVTRSWSAGRWNLGVLQLKCLASVSLDCL